MKFKLIKMKKSEADNKYLIIYSDMLENSSLFSFYGSIINLLAECSQQLHDHYTNLIILSSSCN